MIDRALLDRWADTRGEVRYGPIPDNARRIPIVDRRRTPIVPLDNRQTTPRGAAVYFEAMRRLLGDSGRGSEDVRCAGLLTAIESAWGKTAWNHNINNVKAQGSIYAESKQSILESRQVWTTNQEATEIYLLIDRVNSLDAYHGYSDFSTYFRRSKMLLQRVYPGVIEAWERGELDGLLAGERILGGEAINGRSGPRYSASFAIQRVATARWFWSRFSMIMGEGWRR